MDLKVFKEKLDPKKYDKDLLLKLYRIMLQERVFDESVMRLIAEGTIQGFYHAGAGQEAIAAGSCASLRDDDYIFYAHRGCNEMIAKGVPIDMLYADFFANIHGTNKGLGAGIIHSAYPQLGVLGQPGTIGSNSSLGAGVGYAIKYKQTDQVCVCYFGDGTSSRELIYGALNWMGIWKLPVILFCENNEWAISSHFKTTCAVNDYVSERATGYKDVEVVVCDGNDPLAVKEVMDAAVARARRGEGGTFIEALTYRHGGHFVGDPAMYRDPKVTEDWKTNKDPIINYKKALLDSGMLSEAELDACEKTVREEDEAAIQEALKYPLPPKERLFEGLFSDGKEVLQCRK